MVKGHNLETWQLCLLTTTTACTLIKIYRQADQCLCGHWKLIEASNATKWRDKSGGATPMKAKWIKRNLRHGLGRLLPESVSSSD